MGLFEDAWEMTDLNAYHTMMSAVVQQAMAHRHPGPVAE